MSGEAKDLFESQLIESAEVIYLDPMFPHPKKGSSEKEYANVTVSCWGR